MSTVLRLLIVVPIGFILAVIAAALAVALGIFGVDPSGDAAGWIVLFAAWIAAYAGAFAFMPWLIAVVFAEGFGFRSVWYWFAVGGLIGLAGFALTDVIGKNPSEGMDVAIHLGAGFIGGYVYWLIAGRSSGQGLVHPARGQSAR